MTIFQYIWLAGSVCFIISTLLDEYQLQAQITKLLERIKKLEERIKILEQDRKDRRVWLGIEQE